MKPFPLFDWFNGVYPNTPIFIRLYQSLGTFTNFPSPDDFVEAIYPGYAETLMKPGVAKIRLPDGTLFVNLPSILWQPLQSNMPGCNVQGLYMTATLPSDPESVVLWQPFDTVKPLQTAADFIITPITLVSAQVLTPSM